MSGYTPNTYVHKTDLITSYVCFIVMLGLALYSYFYFGSDVWITRIMQYGSAVSFIVAIVGLVMFRKYSAHRSDEQRVN